MESIQKPFGVRLPIADQDAIDELAQRRKVSRNHLVKEAIKMLLSTPENVEPPAA